jgi:hypothetical protein
MSGRKKKRQNLKKNLILKPNKKQSDSETKAFDLQATSKGQPIQMPDFFSRTRMPIIHPS